MKLGFVTALFPEFSLEEILSAACGEGFRVVEVMCWPVGKAERKFAGVTHIDVSTICESSAKEVAAQCRERGIEISALGYYPNVLDPDPVVSQGAITHLKKVIAAAGKMGQRQVNTFAGRDWSQSVDENWARFLSIWRPIVAFAEDHDVRIGIENCPMSFTRDEWPGGKNLFTTPAIWRRAFSDIDSDHFGLNYDPSHFVLQGMDPVRPLSEFRAKLFHLHAKDVRIDRKLLDDVGCFDFPANWHQPRIPGFGEIDWAAFMAEVWRIGYGGPVCIEVEDDTFGKSLEGRMVALKVARNILAPYFE